MSPSKYPLDCLLSHLIMFSKILSIKQFVIIRTNGSAHTNHILIFLFIRDTSLQYSLYFKPICLKRRYTLVRNKCYSHLLLETFGVISGTPILSLRFQGGGLDRIWNHRSRLSLNFTEKIAGQRGDILQLHRKLGSPEETPRLPAPAQNSLSLAPTLLLDEGSPVMLKC